MSSARFREDDRGGYALDHGEWEVLLRLATDGERATIVERLADELAGSVRRPLLRRAVAAAVKARAESWRGSRHAAVRVRLADEADTATERLAHTLDHMREQQDEHLEPETSAIIAVCGPDLARGCVAAQTFLGAAHVRDMVLPAVRGMSFDREVLQELLQHGMTVSDGLEVASALAEYSWWPLHMRRSVVSFLRDGGEIERVLRCLRDLSFSQLSHQQQRTALMLLQAADTPYDMDGTAVAAALRGIALPGRAAPDLWISRGR